MKGLPSKQNKIFNGACTSIETRGKTNVLKSFLYRSWPLSGYSDWTGLPLIEDKPKKHKNEDHNLTVQLLIASSLTNSMEERPAWNDLLETDICKALSILEIDPLLNKLWKIGCLQ